MILEEQKRFVSKDGERLLNLESSSPKTDKCGWCCPCIPKRYLIAILAFFGLVNTLAMRIDLSVAIIDMVENKTSIDSNGTKFVVKTADFDWDSNAQAVVLSSFYYGYIVTQIPAGYLAAKFGGSLVFGLAILVNAILSLLTPAAARANFFLLVIVRICKGLFQGLAYPGLYAIWSKWAPPMERSILNAISYSGSFAGIVLSMAVSGIIARHLNWDWVFYFFGIISILWSVLWYTLVSDSPKNHPTISDKEKTYILNSLNADENENKAQSTPWKEMLTSVPVWAIVITHITDNVGGITLHQQLPIYLTRVLHFPIQQSGVLSALPYVVIVAVMQVAGFLADYLRKRKDLSTRSVRVLCTTIGHLSQVPFLLLIALTVDKKVAVVSFTLAVGLFGFSYSGYGVNHLDIAPSHASILYGFSNTLANIPGIISPQIVAALTPENTKEEWRTVFFLTASVYAFGTIVFAVFSTGDRQKWDMNDEEQDI